MSNSDDPRERARRFILTRDDLNAMDGTSKVHFLNPDARRTNWSLGDATGLTGLGFHLIEIPAGALSTEYHVHYVEDEAVYVLEGSAEVTLDDEVFELGPGDFVGLPAGGPAHVFRNPGPDPLRCLVVGQRLAHDVADYPHIGKRLYRNKGQWNLVDHDDIVDPKAALGSKLGEK